MQNSGSFVINKTRQCRVVWQWLLALLILPLFGLGCAFWLPKHEPLTLYPEISLPSGSLVFTVNRMIIFRLDSNKPIDEPVTKLYSSEIGSPVGSPVFSPDESKMAFVWSELLPEKPANPSVSKNYPRGLYLLDLTNNYPPDLLWRVHNGPWEGGEILPSSPQWSSEGKKILFLLGNSDHQDIYTLDAETLTLNQILKCEEYCHFIVSAPVSKRLLFTSLDMRNAQQHGTLSLLEVDGTLRVLIEDKGVDYITKPSWSPDEARVAFTMQVDEQGSRSVFLLNTDGTNLSQLTDEGAYHSPVWSPDGKMLAFVEEAQIGERIASRIILMDSQAREMQILLASPTELDDLQWLK